MNTALMLCPDTSTRTILISTLRKRGVAAEIVHDKNGLLTSLESSCPDFIVMEVIAADLSALEEVRRLAPRAVVLCVSSSTASDLAIEAIGLGALDVIPLPLDGAHVKEIAEYISRLRVAETGGQPIREQDPEPFGESVMIGRDARMREVYRSIARVARHDLTVHVHGESGTGKELVARAIYQHSARARAPFLAINVAAIPETLLESELFGHEKGSFTGADRQRIGKFEQCSGGTIFLDEIGDMPASVQSKCLRLLQEQRFERVGGNQTIQVDVRIITATNQDLCTLVAAKVFRSDLYYRLCVYTLKVPPVRDRGDDIGLLLDHYFGVYAALLDAGAKTISADARRVMLEYPWPGNVREMQNAIQSSLLQASGATITQNDLPEQLRGWDALRVSSRRVPRRRVKCSRSNRRREKTRRDRTVSGMKKPR